MQRLGRLPFCSVLCRSVWFACRFVLVSQPSELVARPCPMSLLPEVPGAGESVEGSRTLTSQFMAPFSIKLFLLCRRRRHGSRRRSPKGARAMSLQSLMEQTSHLTFPSVVSPQRHRAKFYLLPRRQRQQQKCRANDGTGDGGGSGGGSGWYHSGVPP